MKRRLVEEVKDIVERVSKMQRELDAMKKTLLGEDPQAEAQGRGAQGAREAEKDLAAEIKQKTDDLEESVSTCATRSR